MKHRDPYSGAGKFSDPADWVAAYVEPSQIDEIEPLPDVQSDYRTAAQTYMATLKTIDVFMSTASNPRLAWITVALTFDLTSIRGLRVTEIAGQMGVSPSALRCSTARFREMAGLDSAGSVQVIRARA